MLEVGYLLLINAYENLFQYRFLFWRWWCCCCSCFWCQLFTGSLNEEIRFCFCLLLVSKSIFCVFTLNSCLQLEQKDTKTHHNLKQIRHILIAMCFFSLGFLLLFWFFRGNKFIHNENKKKTDNKTEKRETNLLVACRTIFNWFI